MYSFFLFGFKCLLNFLQHFLREYKFLYEIFTHSISFIYLFDYLFPCSDYNNEVKIHERTQEINKIFVYP